MNNLAQFGIIPVEYSNLTAELDNYKSVKDKISSLEKNGEIIRLKKGLYVISPKISHQPIPRELVANHLYGPSYVSLETALSFYGLIPERVHIVRSMTIKRSKSFETPLGNYEYITTDKNYYEIGIKQEIVNNQYAFLIASPEKALCDMIITTPRLRIQSVKAMQTYLEEDLRIDFSSIESLNTDIIRQCLETGKKKTELTQLYKLLTR